MKKVFGTIASSVGRFLKRTIAVWIIAGLFGCFALGDFVYYKTFDIELLSIKNQEGGEELYYSTIDNDELIYFTIRLTSSNQPVQGHSIVGIGRSGGQVLVPRIVTNEEGIAQFAYAPYPQYREPKEATGELYLYDEDNSIIIEFRLERTYEITMHKREVNP